MIIPKFVILKGLNNFNIFFSWYSRGSFRHWNLHNLLLQVVHQIHNYNRTCKVKTLNERNRQIYEVFL